MVADANTGEVLGVSMHGLNAAEVIHEAVMGLRFGAKIEDFAKMLHIFPTMAEALKIVALSYTKGVPRCSAARIRQSQRTEQRYLGRVHAI